MSIAITRIVKVWLFERAHLAEDTKDAQVEIYTAFDQLIAQLRIDHSQLSFHLLQKKRRWKIWRPIKRVGNLRSDLIPQKSVRNQWCQLAAECEISKDQVRAHYRAQQKNRLSECDRASDSCWQCANVKSTKFTLNNNTPEILTTWCSSSARQDAKSSRTALEYLPLARGLY